jgi:NADH-quinone oxidoreductase subunit N
VTLTLVDLHSVLPALSLAIGGFAAAFAGVAARPERRHAVCEMSSYAALAVSLGTVIYRLFTLERSGVLDGFLRAVRLDELALFLSLAVLAAAGLTVVLSADYARVRELPLGEYYGLLLLAGSGMLFLVQATELVTFFVAIEILSLAVYALTGLLRKDPRSNEAAIKYFVMGAFASGFLAFGFALLYGATGSTGMAEIGAAVRAGTAGPPSLMTLGLALSLIGLAFKVGAVPFHQWVPDAYEGAPTSVTAFMSTAVKAAAFGGMLRLLLSTGGHEAAGWGNLCWGLSLATMLGGNLLALGQRSVKRMLAYSGVAHTGYVLMAPALMRNGQPGPSWEAASGAVFYLFVYTFMTLGAFAFLVYAGRNGKDAGPVEDLEGLASRRPWAALAMTVFMVSLAGIPPTAGFFGKFLLFKAAVGAGEYALVVAGVLGSAVSLYYYLRVVVAMYMKPPPKDSLEPGPAFNAALVVYAAAVFTLLLGLLPGRYLGLSQSAVSSFFR